MSISDQGGYFRPPKSGKSGYFRIELGISEKSGYSGVRGFLRIREFSGIRGFWEIGVGSGLGRQDQKILQK